MSGNYGKIVATIIAVGVSTSTAVAQVQSISATSSKIKPADVYSVLDTQGATRYCIKVKGKGQYVVKKGKKSYLSGTDKLKALQASLKSAGKKKAKIKKQITAFKLEMKAGTSACRATGSVSLTPLKRALTRADIALLLERAGFGLSATEEPLVTIGLNQGLEALVDEMMTTHAEPAGLLSRVVDELDGQIGSDSTQTQEGQRQAIGDLWLNTNNPYAEKLAMFLLSVWTVSIDVIEDQTFNNSWWNYYQRLRTYAYNDTYLPDMAVEITRDPLMLIYLNNELNVKGNPNENYARELMELFTLGPNDLDGNPNYTETTVNHSGDIAEAAKMLTGWTVQKNYGTNQLDVSFVSSRHEAGPHTMFSGKSYQFSGNDDEDLVRGIFAHHPGVKYYYAKEILKEYLTPNPPSNLVKAFGDIIAAKDYKLRPAMKSLFMSDAFYDSTYQHTVPMQPYDMITRVARTMQLQGAVNFGNLHYEMRRMGFFPNQPPSVFWYPQDSWNSSTIILEKSNAIAALFTDHTAQTNGGWSPQTMLPVGAVSNDALIEFVRQKLNLPEFTAEQKQVLVAFLSTVHMYDGTYASFTYDNSNINHQRSKGLGLYYVLMMTPYFQLH